MIHRERIMQVDEDDLDTRRRLDELEASLRLTHIVLAMLLGISVGALAISLLGAMA